MSKGGSWRRCTTSNVDEVDARADARAGNDRRRCPRTVRLGRASISFRRGARAGRACSGRGRGRAACASSIRAKVESPLISMRSMWSIWKATLRAMALLIPASSRAKLRRHEPARSSNWKCVRRCAGRAKARRARCRRRGRSRRPGGRHPEIARRGRCAGAPARQRPACSSRLVRSFTSTKASRRRRHEVDLADRRPVAPGDDAVAFQAEQERSDALGALPVSVSPRPRLSLIGRSLPCARARAPARRRGSADLSLRDAAHRVAEALRAQRRLESRHERIVVDPASARQAARSGSRSRPWARPSADRRGKLGESAAADAPRAAWSARARPPPRARRARRRCRQGLGEARRRLEEHERRRHRPSARRAASGAPPSAAGSPRTGRCRSAGPRAASAASTADGPGRLITGWPGRDRLAHQLVAGIGDERRAGVADQRHRTCPPPSAASIRGRSRSALCS